MRTREAIWRGARRPGRQDSGALGKGPDILPEPRVLLEVPKEHRYILCPSCYL